MSSSSRPSCPISYHFSDSPHSLPIFTPSMSEFRDFNQFMRLIHPIGEQFGVIKVIPPTEWKANQSNYTDISSSFPIFSPIAQTVSGRAGVFKVLNVKAADEVSVKRFYEVAMKEEKARSKRENELVKEENWSELQSAYWKNIGIMRAPLYGADSDGSLTDKQLNVWNMQDLRSPLNLLGASIGGVTLPFLYYGTWASSFAWHVEDCNLYSINYLHFGRPKQWYAIPPSQANKFESFAHENFPLLKKSCPEYIRHKEVLISPSKLRAAGIQVFEMVHKTGEFMITFAKALEYLIPFSFSLF